VKVLFLSRGLFTHRGAAPGTNILVELTIGQDQKKALFDRDGHLTTGAIEFRRGKLSICIATATLEPRALICSS
jgi:hypothetical protein